MLQRNTLSDQQQYQLQIYTNALSNKLSPISEHGLQLALWGNLSINDPKTAQLIEYVKSATPATTLTHNAPIIFEGYKLALLTAPYGHTDPLVNSYNTYIKNKLQKIN